jgi:PhnB protein
MQIRPYLMFHGRCDEAAAFYRDALGAETLQRMTYADAPDPPPPGLLADNWNDKVMHMALKIGSVEVFMSDGMRPAPTEFKGISLALTVKDAAEAKRRFDALADGGQVTMPMGPTFFTPAFGMAVDRFGVDWMVLAEGT